MTDFQSEQLHYDNRNENQTYDLNHSSTLTELNCINKEKQRAKNTILMNLSTLAKESSSWVINFSLSLTALFPFALLVLSSCRDRLLRRRILSFWESLYNWRMFSRSVFNLPFSSFEYLSRFVSVCERRKKGKVSKPIKKNYEWIVWRNWKL